MCLLGLGLGHESRVVRMSWQYPDNYLSFLITPPILLSSTISSTLLTMGDTQTPDRGSYDYGYDSDSTFLSMGGTWTPDTESDDSDRGVNQVGVALGFLAQTVATLQLVPDKLCTTDLQDELLQSLLKDCQTMTNMPITLVTEPQKLMKNVDIDANGTRGKTYFLLKCIYGVKMPGPLSIVVATFSQSERERRRFSRYSNTTWKLLKEFSQVTSRIDKDGTKDPEGDSLELCHHLAALIEHLSKQSDKPVCKLAVLTLREGFLKACDCKLTEEAWVGSLWSRDLLTASQEEWTIACDEVLTWYKQIRASEEARERNLKKIGLISLACSVAIATYLQCHE